MECPKCHYERKPGDKECPRCGVIYEKWEKHIIHKKEEEIHTKESATPEYSVKKDSFGLGEKILKYKYHLAGIIMIIIIGYFFVRTFSFTPAKETHIVKQEAGVSDKYSKEKTAATEMLKGIQEDYMTLSRLATDEDGLPQLIKEEIDTTPKTNGEFGEMERFMRTYMNNMISQRNDYLLELDAIGWQRILDPERIKQDRNLLESQEMIQRAKDIVEKYRSQIFIFIDNTREDISNLNLSENLKQAMIAGFDKGLEESRPQVEMLWDMEAQIASEFENIFRLLAAEEGSWIVENNQILFKNESDLNTFNSYMFGIQELITKQGAIQNQSVEIMNNKINNALNEIRSY